MARARPASRRGSGSSFPLGLATAPGGLGACQRRRGCWPGCAAEGPARDALAVRVMSRCLSECGRVIRVSGGTQGSAGPAGCDEHGDSESGGNLKGMQIHESESRPAGGSPEK
jgi:hypothetical protein